MRFKNASQRKAVMAKLKYTKYGFVRKPYTYKDLGQYVRVKPIYTAPKEIVRFRKSNHEAISITQFRKGHYGVFVESGVRLGGNLDKLNLFDTRKKAMDFARNFARKSAVILNK